MLLVLLLPCLTDSQLVSQQSHLYTENELCTRLLKTLCYRSYVLLIVHMLIPLWPCLEISRLGYVCFLLFLLTPIHVILFLISGLLPRPLLSTFLTFFFFKNLSCTKATHQSAHHTTVAVFRLTRVTCLSSVCLPRGTHNRVDYYCSSGAACRDFVYMHTTSPWWWLLCCRPKEISWRDLFVVISRFLSFMTHYVAFTSYWVLQRYHGTDVSFTRELLILRCIIYK